MRCHLEFVLRCLVIWRTPGLPEARTSKRKYREVRADESSSWKIVRSNRGTMPAVYVMLSTFLIAIVLKVKGNR